MKIENFRSEKVEGRSRVAATVVWEDCDRPTHELYFETTEEFVPDLSPNPHAFLVASIMPALYYGEARVAVDAEICPELKDGLLTAMSWVDYWHGWRRPGSQLVQIEAKVLSQPLMSCSKKRAGWFCSGGIDSLVTLRTNHLNFPSEHPGFIKDGLIIYGFDFGKVENCNELEPFEQLVNSLADIAADAGITIIPVYPNIRQQLDDSKNNFWRHALSGAALAAVAHAFAQRLAVVSIASSYDIPHTQLSALHPLLIPSYSSYDLRLRYDGIAISRLARTKLVADWDVALQHLRVCNWELVEHTQPNQLNCGQCEKCIRTMTALAALGKLDQASTFPKADVSQELLLSVHIDSFGKESFYRELISPLATQGRDDLVRSIERIIAQYHETDLKGRLKQLDRQYLNGSLRRFKKLVST